MRFLYAYSRWMDEVSEAFGRVADWLVLLSCAVSAGNAFVRYGISYSSNAWLEVQWYMFAGIVMLGASATLHRNEHVRVDLLFGNVGYKTKQWIDVLGFIFFLLPAMALLAWMTWPFFVDSWLRNEGSPNAGGLLRWPVKLALPVGFALLVLQGLSELIKRIALLRGDTPPGDAHLDYVRPEQ